MDHLIVLEGIRDPSEQVICLYRGNRVSLNCTNKVHSALLFELKALLVIGIDDSFDIVHSCSEVSQTSVIKYVFDKDEAI